MKNYVCDDDVVTIAAPAGGTVSGTPVLVGALFGVPATTAVAGDAVALATEGVFQLPKKVATVIAVGARVSWDATHGYIDAPGSGLIPCGVSLDAAGAGTASLRVRLDGIATAVAA